MCESIYKVYIVYICTYINKKRHFSNWIIFLFLGLIQTIARIDYETIKEISLTATVTDVGVPQLTSTADIIVNVINTNDHDPIFNSSEYIMNVLENSPKGTVVGKIQAKDNDDGT